MKTDCLEIMPLFTPAKPHLDNDIRYRNHLCPVYDDCLSKAAVDNMLLDCALCPFRRKKRPERRVDDFEIYGCKALLLAIFFNR